MADRVLGYVPGQPMASDAASVAPADPGAKAPKPTNVMAITPMGVAVNPGNTAGRTGDRGIYQGETDWVVESGSHA